MVAYDPAMHVVQPEEPVVSALKKPTRHAVHTADELAVATVPYMPAAQAVHRVAAVAAAKVPATQAAQPEVPVVSALNIPGRHAVHAAGVAVTVEMYPGVTQHLTFTMVAAPALPTLLPAAPPPPGVAAVPGFVAPVTYAPKAALMYELPPPPPVGHWLPPHMPPPPP